MDSYFRAKDILDKAMGTDSYFQIKSILFGLKAADVVEVTFCKDCRYYQDAKVNEKGFLICPASGMEITEMDYCSYGQRKIETILPKSDAKDESLEGDHMTAIDGMCCDCIHEGPWEAYAKEEQK